ncbi:MAG: hypothetical protein DRN06_09335 [Thermoprotei archaeon]|nr:MAG: hypothetical protein DRN06_09335 [Thermoprotei archaeon]
MKVRFHKKYAKLILERRKTLELRSYPPRKSVYAIQVGFETWGHFRVRGFYRKPVGELTDEEIERAGFRDRGELFSEARRLGFWPECYVWVIELIEDARGAKRPVERGPRSRRSKKTRR